MFLYEFGEFKNTDIAIDELFKIFKSIDLGFLFNY